MYQCEWKDENQKGTFRNFMEGPSRYFMEPFSQNFEVLTQLGDVINPELASKRAQTHT